MGSNASVAVGIPKIKVHKSCDDVTNVIGSPFRDKEAIEKSVKFCGTVDGGLLKPERLRPHGRDPKVREQLFIAFD